MAVFQVRCFYLTCDGATGCDPWEDGTPHFTSVAEALEFARDSEWLVVGESTRCPDCAAKADCAATGYQYDDHWFTNKVAGMPYRYRFCEHCNAQEHDPPWDVLMVVAEAARAVNPGAS